MRRIIRALILSALLTSFSEGMYAPIYAIFIEQIGGGVFEAGATWSVYLIALGLFTIIFGRLGDLKARYKRQMLISGFLIATIGSLGYVFVTKPWHLFIIQFMIGIGWALATPVWDALFSENLDKRLESFEWGIVEGGSKVLSGLAAIFGGIMAGILGFRYIFLTAFFLNLFSTIILIKVEEI